MNESISKIERLLQEIVVHLKAGTTADTRKAVAKLERILALASTLALNDPGCATVVLVAGRFLGCAAHGNAGDAAPEMGSVRGRLLMESTMGYEEAKHRGHYAEESEGVARRQEAGVRSTRLL